MNYALLFYTLIALFFTYEFAKSDGYEIRMRSIRKMGVINHWTNTCVWLFTVLSPWLLFCHQLGLILGVKFLVIALAVRVLIYGPIVHYFMGKDLFYLGTTARWDRFLRWLGLPVWIVSIISALLILVFGKYFVMLLQYWGAM